MFGTLVAAAFATFLWVLHQEVGRHLAETNALRAEDAAATLSDRLSGAVSRAMTQTGELAAGSSVREFLKAPAPATRAAALAELPPNTPPGLRRLEIWDTTGTLLLEIASPSALPDSVDVLRAYPAGEPPVSTGVSPLKAAGTANYFMLTAEVVDSVAGRAVRLGYLRRFGQVTSPGLPIRELLGDEARIRVGSAETGVWSDFYTIASPAPEAGAVAGEYVGPEGERWIGGEAAMAGAPWVMWVGYPRAVVMSPANALLRRLMVIAFIIVGIVISVATLLGLRLTAPLHRLATAAEQIARGDYRGRVPAGRRDEIGSVATSFNTMGRRIEAVHGALRDTQERTEFALASAKIGVWECDLRTGRLGCSESMRVVLGLAPDAPLPASRDDFLDLVHSDDREAVGRVLDGQNTDDSGSDLSFRLASAGGDGAWIEGRARVRNDADGQPAAVLGVIADTTERHDLEAQLRQAQKMEAIGQLAGGIAHDFNNVLTAIVGHAELILAELPEEHPSRNDAREILRSSESAAAMTSQLLMFSRRKLLSPVPVDLHAVVTRAESLIRRLIPADIAIRTELSAAHSTVRIDTAQLEQIIMNLAVNARDAMPGGGTLTIATSNVSVPEDRRPGGVGIAAGDYVVLSVRDSGVGMNADTQRRIFEPFFTTKAPGKGTGLGLSTVFGIARQCGGGVHVHSEAGRGTEFRIHLPLSRDGVAPAPARAEPRGAGANGELILVVEDDPAVRSIACTILKRAGFSVVTAESAEDALEVLASSEREPDLVITDVVMPGMTGPELYRRVVARYPTLPVLFTSGYAGDSLDRYRELINDSMFIEKPYTLAGLVSKIREALDSSNAAG